MLQLLRHWLFYGCCAALAGCATPAAGPSQMIASDDGLSEISVPGAWQTRPNLGRNADLRLADAMHENYLLVTTYRPDDVKDMGFEQFAQRVSAALLENLRDGKMSVARPLAIGGLPAIEYELRGTSGGAALVYFSTVVDGRQARYHLMGWAPADSDTADLRRVMAGFRESAAAREATQRVHLVFKWPEKLNARASFHHKSSKRGGGLELRGESLMTVKPEGKDQLLVSTRVTSQSMTTENPRKGSDDGKRKDLEASLQNVLKAAMTDMPDYVVSSDGEFVRVDNLPAYHKRIQDSLAKGLPKGDTEAPVKARQMLKTLLTEEMLAVSMQDEWNNMVELWAGGSYAVGRSYEFILPYQAPALPQQSFPMVTTQQLDGHVPCHLNAAPRSCVRLRQNTRVSGPEYTRAMNEFVRKTVGGEVSVTRMEVLTAVEVITDPSTMLPYFTHKKQTKRVTVHAEGRDTTTEDVEEASVSYRY